MTRFVTIALLVALLLPSVATAGLSPHTRDGWMVGVSYGGARGAATFADGRNGEAEDGVSPQMRLGRMVTDRLAVGVAYTGWMYETGELPIKYRYTSQQIMAAATWYPRGGGFYVRGGVGLGWMSEVEVEILADEEQGHGDRETDTGPGIELNVGYEFRVARAMAAGVGVGYNHQFMDGHVYESAFSVPVTLNLVWYWD